MNGARGAAIAERCSALLAEVEAILDDVRFRPMPASECIPCERYWAPWIFGPAVGEPCSACGRPTTEMRKSK